MGLHPGERRGAKGTDLGGQFIGPKSIAKFLVKLLKPEHEHKPGGPEPDMRRTMGRFTTAGGSVISARMPSRKPRPDDRVVDTRDARRLGTVATVDHAAGTMRVHWDDGTHEVRPQHSVTDPLREPARSFDAHPLRTSPAARKMTPAPSTPVDRFRQHLSDEVAAGRIEPRQAASAMRAAQGDHVGAPAAKIDRSRPSAADRGHYITSDSSLTDRQKRTRLKSMGMTPEEVDSLVPTKAAKKTAGAQTTQTGATHAEVLDKLAEQLRAIPDGRKTSLGGRSAADAVALYRDRLDSGELQPGQVEGLLQRLLFQNSDAGGAVDPLSQRLLQQSGREYALKDPRLAAAIHDAIEGIRGASTKRAAKKASPAAAKMARGKAATPAFDVADVHSRLASATSREEGRALLQGRTATELRAIAAGSNVHVPAKATKQQMADSIVEFTVARRLDSAAISRPGPPPGTPEYDRIRGFSAPHADGLDSMPDHSLRSYAQEWDIQGARSKSPAELRAALRAQGVGSPEVERAKRIVEQPAAPSAPTVRSEADIVERVHAAVRKLERRPGGWVGLAELRAEVGPDVPREKLDHTLTRMSLGRRGAMLVPESNQKMLQQADREAALSIGNQDKHLIRIEPHITPTDSVRGMAEVDAENAAYRARVASEEAARLGTSAPAAQGVSGSPAVAKMARAAKAAPAKKAASSVTTAQLSAMSTRQEGHAAVASLGKADLLTMARELNIPRASTLKVADLRREIVDATIGRKVDSIATRGFTGLRP